MADYPHKWLIICTAQKVDFDTGGKGGGGDMLHQVLIAYKQAGRTIYDAVPKELIKTVRRSCVLTDMALK
jgi:hypothetical protein